MNAKDLMLGDWVIQTDPIHNGEPAKVVAIHSNGYVDLEAPTGDAITASVAPIPLTAEILEKNGFELERCKVGNIWHLRAYDYDVNWLNGNLCIRKEYAMGREVVFSYEIRYIHQFQHALRLSGIEKEVVI